MADDQIKLSFTGFGQGKGSIRVDTGAAKEKLRLDTNYHAFNTEIIQFLDLIKATVKQYTPRRTGKLAEQWDTQYTMDNKGMISRGKLYNKTENPFLVRWLEFGTRPHYIRPKTASALHFFIDKNEIFTQLVRHPGTRPYKFVQLGRLIIEKNIEAVTARLKTRLLKGYLT